jgi:serine/threonine protein phosphatase 1
MATYVISDIHGYLSRMFDVLEQAHFDWDNDELYVLGDIIDRGPESAEVLIWAMEEAPRNVHFLLGNHEDMAHNALEEVQDSRSICDFMYSNPWSWNGGLSTLDSLREERGSAFCHKAAKWIENLPLYYTLTVNGCSILLVHAGLTTGGVRLSDDFITDGRDEHLEIPKIGEVWSQHLLWIRERWFHDKKAYPYDYIIFGHTPTTMNWWDSINWYREDNDPIIAVQGQPGYIVRMSGYGGGHMRYCIDTGRKCMGLLRLDDMAEFYSTFEIEEDDDE